MEYSRGMPTIPEDSFARLLLRNTSLEEEEVQKYLDRLCGRLKQRKVRIETIFTSGKIFYQHFCIWVSSELCFSVQNM